MIYKNEAKYFKTKDEAVTWIKEKEDSTDFIKIMILIKKEI